MEEPIEDLQMQYRMRWLGHLGRMGEDRLPKKLMFGELGKKRSRHGTNKQWRDGAKSDLQATGIGDEWYNLDQCGTSPAVNVINPIVRRPWH